MIGESGDLWLEDTLVEESLLGDRLKKIRERTPAKELVLFADGRLRMSEVRRTMRAAR